MGGVLLGGIVGEAIGIEAWLERLGDRLQTQVAKVHGGAGQISEAFFTASLLFCVGPLTVVGAIQDGLTGDYQALATKALLDGFASIALAASLGPGVAFAAVSVFVVQGGISLTAGLFDSILSEGSESLRGADERRWRADHRDQSAVAGDQGCEGGELPPCSDLCSGSGWSCEPVLSDAWTRWACARGALPRSGPSRTSRSAPRHSVFKVAGKMFALSALDRAPLEVSLKCEPELAVELRRTHAAIRPGYHLNKRHWNTVTIDDSLPDQLCATWSRTPTTSSSAGFRNARARHWATSRFA